MAFLSGGIHTLRMGWHYFSKSGSSKSDEISSTSGGLENLTRAAKKQFQEAEKKLQEFKMTETLSVGNYETVFILLLSLVGLSGVIFFLVRMFKHKPWLNARLFHN